MNILYLEDNPMDRALVKRYVQTTSHQLIEVSKLDDVDLNTIKVDLILLDIDFGGKVTGLDYLLQMRNMGIQCPAVAVTALALPRQIAGYHQAGIERVVEKPFDITELAEAIAHYE